MNTARDYLKLARIDHWIKQLFILPGFVFATLLTDRINYFDSIEHLVFGFVSTCLIASANYIINEWLDAGSDQYHPTKKTRTAVIKSLSKRIIYSEYALFAILGLSLSLLISKYVFLSGLLLLIMGIVYNVKPFRVKEVIYLDVLTESVNNAIRLLIGWFIATSDYLPPATLVFGFWMGGAYLMAIKRFAEYRLFASKEEAGLYRKSFLKYTSKSLLVSSFFYALSSVFFCGVYMIKYRIELLISIPFLCGLFCYYLLISFKDDSAVQRPEKLFKEKSLIIYILFLISLITVLMFIDIPALSKLLETTLIQTQS